MIVTVKPKSPVTWLVTLEGSEAEIAAWKAFMYRARDGVVDTGITGEQGSVLNNTFSPFYDGLAEAVAYTEP
jgi:hypothetical protein